MPDVAAMISDLEFDLRKCESDVAQLIKTNYPHLPDEYLEFLTTVGWGEIAGFMLYNAPLDLDEVFDAETVASCPQINLIGDDLAGFHLGYIETPGGWKLTSFDHVDLPGCPSPDNKTLEEFLLAWIGEVK